MCGRYTLQSPSEQIADLFDLEELGDWKPRYNIAPTQEVLAIVQREGERELSKFRWGLIPFFAKDKKSAARMINARGETVAEKPAFRAAFKKRRCLVPADGFYEWKQIDRGKQPFHIHLKSRLPFAMAGIFESWKSPEGEVVDSVSVITTEPNELTGEIHDRMPVILSPDEFAPWLDPALIDKDLLTSLLQPYPADEMAVTRVSKLVNSPRNDGPECLEPQD